jgi:cyclophilin family peptidyl-prolyl cis-trans isomerase
MERRAPRFSNQRRKDLTVLLVAIVCIIAVLGGYILFYYYGDIIDPSNDNGDDNVDITPTPQPGNNNNNNNNDENPIYEVPDFTLSVQSNPVVVIEVKNYGAIVIELYRHKNVQITVDNFLDYARRDFYDGLIFHRVIDGFMIQGGGFFQDMTQKTIPPDKSPIPLEIDPSLEHKDGAIAMARTGDPNSATSQFFINDGAQPQLEPGGVDQYGYAVFGQVVGGMSIVRQISSVTTQTEGYYDDVPVNDVIIENVYEYFG